jgi:hypothetical protein
LACRAAADGVCCDHKLPELVEIEAGHHVSCHLYRVVGEVSAVNGVAEPVA